MTRANEISYLVPLIQNIVVSKMAGSRPGGASETSLTLTAMSFVLTSAGLVFVLFGEYLWLKTYFQSDTAAIIVAGTSYVLALVTAVIGKAMDRRKKNEKALSLTEDASKAVSQIINSLSAELESPVRENPKTAMVLASLAGFVAGERRVEQ